MSGEGDETRGLIELARRAAEGLEQRDDERGLHRLVHTQRARVAARAKQRPVFVVGGLAVAASLSLVAFFVVTRQTDRTLSYAVIPQPGTEDAPAGGSLPPPTTPRSAGGSTRYAFSDGSSMVAASGSTVDVLSLKSRGAAVRLGRGHARVHVVHRDDTRWRIDAGPFVVEVVGTRFDLAWDPVAARFSLRLSEGAVDVRGPTVEGALHVISGQSLVVSLATGRVSLSQGQAAQADEPWFQSPGTPGTTQRLSSSQSALKPRPSTSPSAPAAAAAAPPTELGGRLSDKPTDRTAPTGALATVPSIGWRALVARGQFDRVIAEARGRPLKECISRCSLDELRALGDAARYSGHISLAARAYDTLRRRFAGTSDGTAAAFLLGRTYEAKGEKGEAERWYRQYLSEAPAGEFAVEAASGKARVTRRN